MQAQQHNAAGPEGKQPTVDGDLQVPQPSQAQPTSHAQSTSGEADEKRPEDKDKTQKKGRFEMTVVSSTDNAKNRREYFRDYFHVSDTFNKPRHGGAAKRRGMAGKIGKSSEGASGYVSRTQTDDAADVWDMADDQGAARVLLQGDDGSDGAPEGGEDVAASPSGGDDEQESAAAARASVRQSTADAARTLPVDDAAELEGGEPAPLRQTAPATIRPTQQSVSRSRPSPVPQTPDDVAAARLRTIVRDTLAPLQKQLGQQMRRTQRTYELVNRMVKMNNMEQSQHIDGRTIVSLKMNLCLARFLHVNPSSRIRPSSSPQVFAAPPFNFVCFLYLPHRTSCTSSRTRFRICAWKTIFSASSSCLVASPPMPTTIRPPHSQAAAASHSPQ
jgi:hypothetical protein